MITKIIIIGSWMNIIAVGWLYLLGKVDNNLRAGIIIGWLVLCTICFILALGVSVKDKP